MGLKDRKILFELSKDSRLSAAQIAKRVGLSKDAVIYRMRSLEEKKIIQKYITVVNLKKLNYRTHVIFFEFKRFDIETERSAISFLADFPYIIWVASPSGRWDIIIDVISKDADQFDEVLTELLTKLGNNLKNYEVLETIKEFYYCHKYLTGGNIDKRKEHIAYDIDDTDYLILKELSQNSRRKSTDIAKKLMVSHDQVSYRIRKLLKSGFIEQFSVLIDFSKLDLSYYYLLFLFNNLSKPVERSIIEFLRSRSEVLFFGKNTGKYNFNIDIIVENPIQLKGFIMRLRDRFGAIIESRETLLMFGQIKNDYFPDGILTDVK